MPLYPLGISRSRDVSNDLKPESGTPEIRWRHDGELACAFVDAPHGVIKPLHYMAALEAIHRRASVLPVKFGVELKDETAIDGMLQKHQAELLDRLVRVEGTCEMTVKISRPQNDPADNAEKEVHNQADVSDVQKTAEQDRLFIQNIIERLQGLYRDWRRLHTSTGEICLAFLIQRDRAVSFKNRITATLNACGQVSFSITGPRPPYSFV